MAGLELPIQLKQIYDGSRERENQIRRLQLAGGISAPGKDRGVTNMPFSTGDRENGGGFANQALLFHALKQHTY